MIYDYIIVGAGSAVCVLANRLSEDERNQVLLIEAGGRDSHPLIPIPGAYMRLHRSSADWNCYWTESQTHLAGRKIYHPRGKVLGGCSATNAMAYIRGQREDYDEWATLGCAGWSFEDVLPFFRKSENNEQFENKYHAKGGLLNVTRAHWYRTVLAETFIEACAERGIPRNQDVNGEVQEGAGWFQYTMKDARRYSAASAFLVPALKRRNLSVVTHALCKKIVIEKDEATGVEFMSRSSNTLVARARREVILCAGAFESPKILMLSGIGERDQLSRHRVDRVVDLPGVGQNLQDHLFYPVSSLCNQPVSNNHYLPIHRQVAALARYLWKKTGPLSIGPLEAVAFLRTDATLTRPDLQFQFTPTNAGDGRVANMYDISTFPHSNGYTILPTQVRPKSRGEVRLQSADPRVVPLINPNYLSHEEDRKVMIAGGRKALEVLEASAFAALRIRNHIPAQHATDEDWLQHIAQTAECVYHPVGTCKMGVDAMAVVDPELRVRGVGKLRVADASVMPTISSGNTNAPVIMIGEKAADLILR